MHYKCSPLKILTVSYKSAFLSGQSSWVIMRYVLPSKITLCLPLPGLSYYYVRTYPPFIYSIELSPIHASYFLDLTFIFIMESWFTFLFYSMTWWDIIEASKWSAKKLHSVLSVLNMPFLNLFWKNIVYAGWKFIWNKIKFTIKLNKKLK